MHISKDHISSHCVWNWTNLLLSLLFLGTMNRIFFKFNQFFILNELGKLHFWWLYGHKTHCSRASRFLVSSINLVNSSTSLCLFSNEMSPLQPATSMYGMMSPTRSWNCGAFSDATIYTTQTFQVSPMYLFIDKFMRPAFRRMHSILLVSWPPLNKNYDQLCIWNA